jgi:hypothetical protein
VGRSGVGSNNFLFDVGWAAMPNVMMLKIKPKNNTVLDAFSEDINIIRATNVGHGCSTYESQLSNPMQNNF